MPMSSFPVEDIREEFLALQRIENGHFVSYFDAASGTQVAKSVVDAMTTYMKNGVANLGGVYPTSRETAALVFRAREHAAHLLGAKKENIVFGANVSFLAMLLSCLLGKRKVKNKASNIVVTEMNHQSNLNPWEYFAQAHELSVNIIPVNPSTYTLDYKNIDKLINEETELVAIDFASHLIGSVHDVETIIHRANEVGALVILNATHVVPYFSLNFEQMDV